MLQPTGDLSEAMENLSVTDSDDSFSSKNLSDMPVDVVRLIIERSDYKEQLILRKTSKSLRSLVDEQQPACKSIKVDRIRDNTFIYFNNRKLLYTPIRTYKLKNFEGVDVIVGRNDYEKVAFDDLASSLKHPKLQLEEFEVYHYVNVNEFYKNIQNVLKSLNHQLSVEKCSLLVCNPYHFLSVLPYLKPGVLKTISFDKSGFDWSGDSEGMDQVAALDQWKQAEELELVNEFEEFPIKHAAHFKRFYIYEDRVDSDKFIRIRDYLAKLDNFEHCELGFNIFQPFDEHLGRLVSSSDSTEKIYHYPIPDSEDYLEFKTSSEYCIHIYKKKRPNRSF